MPLGTLKAPGEAIVRSCRNYKCKALRNLKSKQIFCKTGTERRQLTQFPLPLIPGRVYVCRCIQRYKIYRTNKSWILLEASIKLVRNQVLVLISAISRRNRLTVISSMENWHSLPSHLQLQLVVFYPLTETHTRKASVRQALQPVFISWFSLVCNFVLFYCRETADHSNKHASIPKNSCLRPILVI